MFTVDDVNKEIQNYIKYTSYDVPTIQEIIYVDTLDYYGEVSSQEILEGKYIIRFSNSLNDCPIEFQKSVIWHEVTHIIDAINNKELNKSTLECVMSTYSEAHANSIQLRYLLHITPKQIVNQGKRYLIYSKGREDLSIVTSNYINQSLHHLTSFRENKIPRDFKQFISQFSYFCGYMFLKKRTIADELSDGVISKFPNEYQSDLKNLYTHILNLNFVGCASVYTKLKAEAMIYSLPF